MKTTVQQQIQAAGFPLRASTKREKPEFEKKPISLQAQPLGEILDKCDVILEALGEENPEVSAVVQEIVEIADRRLLELQIADTHGWETVRHFNKGKLGKTAAQQKQIRDAVAASAAERSTSSPKTASGDFKTTYNGNRARQPFPGGPSRGGPNPTIGNCFECGQPGHYAANCPSKKGTSQGGDDEAKK